jgi:hypothetical protein
MYGHGCVRTTEFAWNRLQDVFPRDITQTRDIAQTDIKCWVKFHFGAISFFSLILSWPND